MRVLTCVAIAGGMLAAAPALAQNNAEAAVANQENAIAAGANAAAVPTPTAPTTPGGEPTTLPPTVTTENTAGTAPIVGQKAGFPWGVLGLLGLVGLFGRRRSS